MKKNRIKIYWVLLLTLMYTASTVLAVGEAHARFENTITESTVLDSRTASGITSNCLVSSQGKPVTVLLGELPLEGETTVPFWMHSAGADASGKLLWGVSDPAYADYLKISMLSGYDVIEPGAEIDLLEDVTLELSMVLAPTNLARDTVHEALKITVLVTWGEDMWGAFQVFLPEVKAETSDEEMAPEQDTSENPSVKTEEDVETDVSAELEGEIETGTDLPDASTGSEGESLESGDDHTDISTDPEGDNTETNDDQPDLSGDPESENAGSDDDQTDLSTDPEEDNTETNDDQPDLSTDPEGDNTETNDDRPDLSTDPEGENAESNDDQTNLPADSGEKNTVADENQSEESEDPKKNDIENSDDQDAPSEGEDGDSAGSEEDENSDLKELEETEEADPEEAVETEPEEMVGTEPVEVENPEDMIHMDTLSRFDPAGGLPVKLSLTTDVTSVRLGLYSSKEENKEMGAEGQESPQSVLAPFFDGTKFSLDGGECYYMMYQGCIAEFTVQNMTSLSLVLDFSCTSLQEDKELKLAMEAYAGEELLASCVLETMTDAQEAFQLAVLSREQVSAGEEARAAARAAYSEEGIILNQNNVLEILLPMEWREMGLEYSLERLIMTERSTLAYIPVKMSDDSWLVEYTNDDNHHDLLIQTGNTLPQAGTYRLTLQWSYEEICYAQSQTTFFINYSAQSNHLLSGGGAEND